MEGAKVIFAWGSRKRAVARLRLKENGKGRVYVNGLRPLEYFKREDLVIHALEPLKIVGLEGKFDVVCKVEGGGKSGQAGAMRLALARALKTFDENLTEVLKKFRLLSRDPREKERMKYGKSKRRKSPQYSKR
uniref:30S ribosomal protein S9 n=1 Tax=candidate division WOR-3 bacterium TaxID=2052148 RepID=A0A7V3ZXL7_UNCW3